MRRDIIKGHLWKIEEATSSSRRLMKMLSPLEV